MGISVKTHEYIELFRCFPADQCVGSEFVTRKLTPALNERLVSTRLYVRVTMEEFLPVCAFVCPKVVVSVRGLNFGHRIAIFASALVLKGLQMIWSLG